MKKSKYLEMLGTILLSPVMLMFSFFSLGAMGLTACAYMAVVTNYISSGRVMDASTSNVIEGIRVRLLDESSNLLLEKTSDTNGCFDLGKGWIEKNQSRIIVLEDVDGNSNSGAYLPETNSVDANFDHCPSLDFYLEK